MLSSTAPIAEPRPEIEFRYGGEAHIARPPDPVRALRRAMGRLLYMRTNPKGLHAERWRHIHGCARFFNAVRAHSHDRFLATYKVGEPRPAILEPAAEPVLSAGNRRVWHEG